MSEQRELILELFKHPTDLGELANRTHEGHKHNASCGDEFTIQLIVEKDVIADAKFTGAGCAISTAAICLLLDEIKGKKLSVVQQLTAEDMTELLGIPISAGRIKCATLGLDIVKEFS